MDGSWLLGDLRDESRSYGRGQCTAAGFIPRISLHRLVVGLTLALARDDALMEDSHALWRQ